jgi:hypothetical protein
MLRSGAAQAAIATNGGTIDAIAMNDGTIDFSIVSAS